VSQSREPSGQPSVRPSREPGHESSREPSRELGSEPGPEPSRSLDFVHLGFGAGAVEYTEAWQEQRRVHAARFADEIGDTCLMLEHPPVYTAGRRTADDERPLDGTPVVDVDRGGKITWHGPGQLVGYPILKLPRPVDVVAHVRRLEEALIRTAAEFGLETSRVEGRSGVWVLGDAVERRSRDAAQVAGFDRGTREEHAAGAESRRSATDSTQRAAGGLTLDFHPRPADEEFDPRLSGPEYAPSNAGQRGEDRKLAAIGIRVAKGVTMHGFAFNCNPDTTWFDRIVPCGIRDAGVTSLSAELGREVTVAEVLPVAEKHLADVLTAAVLLPRAV
jgi:lipoyl(octanoyl) transferase